MKKAIKIITAVLAISGIMSTVSLASDTWVQEGNDWFCYTKSGEKVYGEWKVNQGHYYYLDEQTGAAVRNRVIENGDKKYFCGPDGIKATGWVRVPVDNGTDGFEYMYFNQLEGSANLGESNIINQSGIVKKYRFDENTGYMLYGFLSDSWDSVDSPSEATYYYGDKESGTAYTGWINIQNGEDPNYPDDASKWFYFYKGRKIFSTVRQIEGKRYTFDEKGAMITGWSAGTDSSAVLTKENARYYGTDDEGEKYRSRWFKATAFDAGSADEDEHWYYAQGSGEITVNRSEDIDGRYYFFDTEGHAVTGIIVTDDEGKLSEEWTALANKSLEEYLKVPTDMNIAYYPECEELPGRGYRLSGKQTVTVWDDETEIYFDGHGVKNGALPFTKPKYAYNNGFMLKAEAGEKCALVRVSIGGYDTILDRRHYYIVNENGAIMKGKVTVDSDDVNWAVNGNYEIFKCRGEYASSAAKSLLKEAGNPERGYFKVKGKKYECEITPVYDGEEIMYSDVTWHPCTE